MDSELHDDLALEPELPGEQLESTVPPDVAPENPMEEPKVPSTVRKLYDSFTRVAHPVMLS